MANRQECDQGGMGKFPDGAYRRMKETMTRVAELSSDQRTIVWRTNGFSSTGDNTDVSLELNRLVRERFEAEAERDVGERSNMVLLDWGNAIYPRSFGDDRIVGDIPYHYGLEARLAGIQMLMNVLVERDAENGKIFGHDT